MATTSITLSTHQLPSSLELGGRVLQINRSLLCLLHLHLSLRLISLFPVLNLILLSLLFTLHLVVLHHSVLPLQILFSCSAPLLRQLGPGGDLLLPRASSLSVPLRARTLQPPHGPVRGLLLVLSRRLVL